MVLGIILKDKGVSMTQRRRQRDQGAGQVVVKKEPKTRKPSMYKVILHNDDYTPMDLVTEILIKFFQKSFAEATHIMLTVHHRGIWRAG